MMDDLRWGQIRIHHNPHETDQTNLIGEETWEWLVHALQLDRVRSTLAQFPIGDSLEPIRFNCECTGHPKDVIRKAEFSSNFEDEVLPETDMSVITQQNSHSSVHVGNDLWRGDGDDLRYSPGFLLPLILATIEAYLPHEEIGGPEHPGNTNKGKNDADIASCKMFGGVCRRICDKGGIALAIGSLSSHCCSLRKVAVAICGLFLKALQMQESQGIKSWRERPQLEMILSSIQRGLVIRRATQMQRYNAQEGVNIEEVEKYNIPLLPAVSTTFLAKALLILSNPSDNMYGQMNRYFLRLTDCHGAFQDFFGLPAFLSLYCSSSGELTRCKSERTWALLTLKDSAVDVFCYRIISQCHVPELLMSSFDGLLDNPESTNELYLTIDIIEALLLSGGNRASNHLITREGLLSWLHGIVSWRNATSLFSSVTLRCRFLELITTSVNCYRNANIATDGNETNETAFYEKVPLANTAIRICLGGFHDLSQESRNTLLEDTCNALWAIYVTDIGSQVDTTSQGLTTLCDATSLLKKAVCLPSFGKLLASVCHLPLVTTDSDLSSAKLFCELTLGFLLQIKMQIPPNTTLTCLKKVQELIRIYPCLGNSTNLRLQVIECRHVAVMVGGVQVWNRFLPHLNDSMHVVPKMGVTP